MVRDSVSSNWSVMIKEYGFIKMLENRTTSHLIESEAIEVDKPSSQLPGEVFVVQ